MSLKTSYLKRRIFVVCFLLIIYSVFLNDKVLAEGPLCTKQSSNGNNNSKDANNNGKEVLVDEISQSEESRNNKTFQVAKVIIKASPQVVFNTFTDYKRATEIFSYLKVSKILTVEGSKKTILCEAEIANGLFRFQYVLEFIEHTPNLVEWHRISGSFKANEGYWKFEPVDNGHSTLVTYSKYVDAGFLFPQFLVKKELQDNMPVILGELKHSVESVAN